MRARTVYQAGWRPAAGWVAVYGLAYSVTLQPLLAWFSTAAGIPPPPTLNGETLALVAGIFAAAGAMRSAEKIKGVQDPASPTAMGSQR